MTKEITPKMINNESLWNYIDKKLKAQNIDGKYLIQLFDITPKALFNWKNGDASISQDKLVILCNLFGVTIDEMLEEVSKSVKIEEDKISNQEINKKIIEECNVNLRDKLNSLERKPLHIETACYFKEQAYQFDFLSFENDWKSYYYEFGMLFNLIDVYKEFVKKNTSEYKDEMTNSIYDFKFDKYIKCDRGKLITDYFGNAQTFVTTLRCMTVAHPINSSTIEDQTVYYSLNQIWVDEDCVATSFLRDALNMVSCGKDKLRLQIQKYDLKSDEETENLFSIAIDNRFFGDYYKFVTNIFMDYLNYFPTEEEIEEKKLNEILNYLSNPTNNLKSKLAKIKVYEQKEYKDDIKYGHIPFDVRFIDVLLKQYDEDLANIIINTTIDNIRKGNGVDCFDLRGFEDLSGDHKDTTYWFDGVNLTDLINCDFIESNNFAYYYQNMLFNVFDVGDIITCKTYFDLLVKIIYKNIEIKTKSTNK